MVTTMASDPFAPPPPRVEVITSVQRRRRWSTADKVRLVEEAMQPGLSVSYVARQRGVAPSLLFAWKRRMQEGGFQAVAADEDVVGTSRVRELERRVRQLECLLGRKTLENEILKDALELARPKKRPRGRARGPRTLPDEGHRRHAGRGPFQPGRGSPRAASASAALSEGRRRRAPDRLAPSGRRAPDLRLPPARRPARSRAS